MHCPPGAVQGCCCATYPRLHHIQHLNEVTVGRGCSVGHQRKMAAACGSVCFSSTESAHIYSCDEGI